MIQTAETKCAENKLILTLKKLESFGTPANNYNQRLAALF
jgi:hypothetical protein